MTAVILIASMSVSSNVVEGFYNAPAAAAVRSKHRCRRPLAWSVLHILVASLWWASGLAPSHRYLGNVWSWRYLSCLHLLEQVVAERLGRNNRPQAAHRIANFILRCCSALRCSARLVA
jgi:hypothetical protein